MSEIYPRAGFVKRLAVIVYDLLAVIALAMLLSLINLGGLFALESFGLFTLTGYQDHSAYLNQQWWYKVETIAVIWGFYAWFWHDGGQTLGMRAWRVKIQSTNDEPVSFIRAAKRALFALFGLGNILVLLMPKTKLSLQDRLTNTEMVVLTKEANKQVYLRGIEEPLPKKTHIDEVVPTENAVKKEL
ncbi:RDD family protein [Psychrosphaera saromensis]|uniref:RDD domain-containing protein n=1 Tax=Psychrosphaera saromensis TaxID=716813 RepID=A0A2S7USE3_9GAMM|nr:RDD family protein [Psychrosphaera saromensis]PQJ52200.1 hypothetical protein BTO11_00025 [Psychrosphaera saromensis]GHB79228.1 RDD family protein [Psychrosphaera saromensis]GLQ13722.1 RDD family protein [Psychrosphaera saromensis]